MAVIREIPGDALPDFVALFPLRDEEAWQFTPRTARILYDCLVSLSADGWSDVRSHDGEPVPPEEPEDPADDERWALFDRLPAVSWPLTDQAWRLEVVTACGNLAADIAAGRRPTPRCVAEELLLAIAVDDAEGSLYEAGILPEVVHHDDADWDGCRELLFQDSDYRALYEAGQGETDPRGWFTPFDNVEPRAGG